MLVIPMEISVIIPTLNEKDNLRRLLPFLYQHSGGFLKEIIVVDGGSCDGSPQIAQELGAKAVVSTRKGRAPQMNQGAQLASGDVLYFVHADTLPPATYARDISQAMIKGYDFGSFRYKFDRRALILRINAYFTRFKPLICQGGDKTLFILKERFEELNGYDESYVIMEEYDFFLRARKKYRYLVASAYVTVSSRKYERHSYLYVNSSQLLIFILFRLRVAPHKLKRLYKWLFCDQR